MTREGFLAYLEARLGERGVPVRRWQVEPGLEDLEIQGGDGQAVKLRIVRTAGSGGSQTPRQPSTRIGP